MSESCSDEELPAYDLGGGCSYKPPVPDKSSVKRDIPPATYVDKMSKKQLRTELKKRDALGKRRLAKTHKLEKEHEKAERQLQKEIENAKKKATRDSHKDDQPSKRLKHMVVMIGTALAENPGIMSSLATKLSDVDVEYHVCNDDCPHPGTISWYRRSTERTVSDQAQILTRECKEEQNEVLVIIEAQSFAGLVKCTKLTQCDQPLSDGEKTFQEFVEELLEFYPHKRVTLVVQGLEGFLRGNKTHQNRQYRKAVTGRPAATKTPSQRLFSDVSRLDCEEVLVGVQLTLGLIMRMCEDIEEVTDYILNMTKAISDSHYKHNNPFSFHAESGQGPSKQALSSAGSKVSLIFKHQLMQFNNVSEHMAAAVVNLYPSPANLINAYDNCQNTRTAQLLLQDIEVRRGVGVVSSTRRLGPTHSKRIHRLMTVTDKTLTLE